MELPTGLTDLGSRVFYNCSGITEVEFPTGLTSIGYSAFSGCSGVTSITVYCDLSIVSVEDFINLTEVTLGENVTEIPEKTFYNLYKLTQINLPDSLTSIGASAFYYCIGLTELTFPTSLTSIGDSAFCYCTGLTELSFPTSLTSIGDSAFYGCTGLTEVVFPESLTSIGTSAFYKCNAVTSITVSCDLSIVPYDDFTNLTEVTIGENITEIPEEAFYNLSKLTQINLPDNLTSIGASAFYGCIGLTELIFSTSLTSIGASAFYGCTGLTELSFPISLTNIGDSAFYGCTGLTGLTFSTSLTSIGASAFYGCTGLTELSLPTSLTSIGDYAFYGCTGFSEMVLPDGLISIGSYAFASCGNSDGWFTVTVPKSVTSIGSNVITSYALAGYSGSYAETYANDNSILFIYLDGESQQEDITVESTDELLEAIGSNRHIILKEGIYRLSEPLSIYGISNMTIEAEYTGAAEFLAKYADMEVVNISGSVGIEIKGCILGHTTDYSPSATCPVDGNVIYIDDSVNIKVTESDLYGCGYIGIYYNHVKNLAVADSVIRDCTVEAIASYSSWSTSSVNESISVTNCIISGVKKNSYSDSWSLIGSTDDIAFTSCTFMNNYNGSLAEDGSAATFTDCIFSNNVWDGGTPEANGVCLNGVTWQVTDGEVSTHVTLTLQDGTQIESTSDVVLDYSDYSLPWKKYVASGTGNDDDGDDYDYDDDDDDDGDSTDENLEDDANYSQGIWAESVSDYTYTGSAIKPTVRVYSGTTRLTLGTDYTVSYKNNTNAGTASITVKGKGSYAGTDTVDFAINPVNIEGEDITADGITLAYNGKTQTAKPVVYFGSKKLSAGKDYTVSGNTQASVGQYEITLTGAGNFTGKRTLDFGITDATLISKAKVSKIAAKAYTGSEITLTDSELVVSYGKETLQNGTDYTVSYSDNVNAGTATVTIKGKGNYAGTKKAVFVITGTPIKSAKVSGLSDLEYTGSARTLSGLTLTYNGAALTLGTDYTLKYANNTKAGKATVTITGTGAYSGSVKKNFKITAREISDCSVSVGSSAPYSKGGATADISVSYNETALVLGTDYIVSYKNNKAAESTATVTVKGKGNFTGAVTKQFTVTKKALSDVIISVP
ncbi:MAG: leucine-rich repeat protein, partial [Lachnospiraceae bacterium]|nr:leucine-rich repeat protein [Lachnospiraceae bacterium]